MPAEPRDTAGFGRAQAHRDLPPLREVGRTIASYCPIGDVEAWTTTGCGLLNERAADGEAWAARRASAVADARRFDALEHARQMLDVYRELIPALSQVEMTNVTAAI